MRNAFADVIYEIGQDDPRICALVADISPAGSIEKFREQFPERFINTGVAEQAMIGIAAGLALKGMRPFCYTIATFSLYRPFEMIRVDLGYQNLPVTVIGMGAGVIYSTLGGTHHSMEDVAVAGAIPNMTVLAPCDPAEMRHMTHWCATQSQGPVYMRLGKAGEPDLTASAIEPFEVGKMRYLQRGTDVALISYGITVSLAMKVAAKLEASGKSVSVLSCHTIKPLDRDGVQQVLASHKRVAVIEEHVPHGGLGSRIKEIAWETQANCSLDTFSLKDEFIHCYGSHDELLAAHGLSVGSLLEKLL
ncbi:MAG: transketolase [Proteobacteria bacterium]|nr:transketolase [Pseudomonadota bacterium]